MLFLFELILAAMIIFFSFLSYCDRKTSSDTKIAKNVYTQFVLGLSSLLLILLVVSFNMQLSFIKDCQKLDDYKNHMQYINEFQEENDSSNDLISNDLAFLNSLIEDLDKSIKGKIFWLYLELSSS